MAKEKTTLNFAYVKFLEDHYKATVPISDIKNFDRDFHEVSKVYYVHWGDSNNATEGYFKAQILMLAESENEIQKRIKDGPRLKIPKIIDTSVEETDDEEPPELVAAKSDASAIAQKKKVQTTATHNATKTALKKIISQKLAMKRKADSKVDQTSGTAVEKSLRLQIAKLKKEKQELLSLNMRLQEEVISKFTAGFIPPQHVTPPVSAINSLVSQPTTPPGPPQSASTPQKRLPPTPPRKPEPPKSVMPSTSQTSTPFAEPELPNEAVDGMVCLGQAVTLSPEVWQKIRSTKKHSIFVKDLAVAVFGTETLLNSSLEGKISPRYKKVAGKVAKPALSSLKLQVIEGCFKTRLASQNLSSEEVQTELNKMKKYIGEKIQDMNKKALKASNGEI